MQLAHARPAPRVVVGCDASVAAIARQRVLVSAPARHAASNGASILLSEGMVMQSRRLLGSSASNSWGLSTLRHPWTISIAVCGRRCGQVSLCMFNLH